MGESQGVSAEIKQHIDNIVYLLDQIANDFGVPRNIRAISQEAIECLQQLDEEENTPGFCASNSRSLLDEVSQDLNCPLHIRTKLYQVLSMLEQIQD